MSNFNKPTDSSKFNFKDRLRDYFEQDGKALPPREAIRTDHCLEYHEITEATNKSSNLYQGKKAHINHCAWCQSAIKTFANVQNTPSPLNSLILNSITATLPSPAKTKEIPLLQLSDQAKNAQRLMCYALQWFVENQPFGEDQAFSEDPEVSIQGDGVLRITLHNLPESDGWVQLRLLADEYTIPLPHGEIMGGNLRTQIQMPPLFATGHTIALARESILIKR
jgi:hypothetical protein